FFAAYHLLNNMSALTGVSWLCFTDLSRPDALLSLGTFSVNILPFVMTAANLISVAVYTSRLTAKEKRNLLLLALLFLALLYPSSTALLIYWTCNNIFSLGKNLVYAHFVYAEKAGVKQAGGVRPAAGRRRWLDAGLAGLSVVALAGALILRKHASLDLWPTLPAAASPLLACAAARLRFTALAPEAAARHSASGRGLASLAAIAGALAALCVWMLVDAGKLYDYNDVVFYLVFSLAVGGLLSWSILRCPLSPRLIGAAQRMMPEGKAGSLFAAATALMAGLVCWQTPLSVYASDPLFFSEPVLEFVGHQIFNVVFFLVVNGLIFHWANRDIRQLLALVWSWLAICALLFTFAAAGDYGHVDGMVLQKTRGLDSKLAYLVDPAVFLAGALLLRLALSGWGRRRGQGRGRGANGLALLLQGAALALAVIGVYQAVHLPARQPAARAVAGAELPPYNGDLFGFSRPGANTLILMTDMFTGSHLGQLLEERPDFAEKLDGFTWYPDTVSPGRNTMTSIAAILGGENYAPLAINARQPARLADEMHQGFTVLPEIYGPRGYSVSLAGVFSLNAGLLADMCPSSAASVRTAPENYENDYLLYWHRKNGTAPPPETRHASFLTAVGVFRAAPWSLRKSVYGRGTWLRTRSLVGDNRSERMYALLDLLPDISNSTSRASTVKYLAVNLTHSPWLLDASCAAIRDPGRMPAQRGQSGLRQHLIAERCTLEAFSRWFDWMKAEGVYDNTQIIIVSDHDGEDSLLPRDGFDEAEVNDGQFTPDALLLVKQRGRRGRLLLDARPMSSGDVVPLICAADGPCPGLTYQDPLADSAAPGMGPRVRTHVNSKHGVNPANDGTFDLESVFRVTGTGDDPKNWEILRKH
ncbi:MAG: sulfatase-like hydrolase/transferase, partial [Deltaproteobacteria bacterium]|nr:sulfatase-like hydrolase/transferase [Deltaproteobacteria bacterium]